MSTSAKSLVGTQTQKNLATAYLAESSAYSRYVFFSKAADKEGYPQFAEIFQKTADNELNHAKVYFKYLCEANATSVPMEVDAGVIGKTLDNLKVAAREELKEGVGLYTDAAKVAKEEGFDDIADHFAEIATIEKHHHDRFIKMAELIESGNVWKSENGRPIKWQCRVCGYIYEGVEPPEVCPACNHPRKHYQRETVFF